MLRSMLPIDLTLNNDSRTSEVVGVEYFYERVKSPNCQSMAIGVIDIIKFEFIIKYFFKK